MDKLTQEKFQTHKNNYEEMIEFLAIQKYEYERMANKKPNVAILSRDVYDKMNGSDKKSILGMQIAIIGDGKGKSGVANVDGLNVNPYDFLYD